MRIALVHMRHAHSGGTERYLNLLSQELAEQGHQVDIICRSHEAPSHPDINFVVLKPFSIGKAHRIWRFARAVERYLQQHEYDLVYGLGKTWTHDVIRIGGGSHKRFLSRMGLPGNRFKDRVSMAIVSRAFAPGKFQAVIANSKMCAQEIIEDFQIPADKVKVIYNSVDLSRFQDEGLNSRAANLRRDLGLQPDALVYLFLGSGYERKGLRELLQSYAEVKQKIPDAQLLVVGYDSRQSSYQQLAQELGISNIHFLGGRRDTEVIYKAADVYVLPTHYDPFANTTLEALAAGLPVITTDSNGGSEILNDEIGSVVNLKHGKPALTSALMHWADPQQQTAARARCQAKAAELSHEHVMAKTRGLLEQLAAGK